jgi:outer membrane immunogenic protein
MKRLLLGSIALAAFSTAAVATDVTPVPEALPPAEAAPYNWTGLYGRLNTLAPNDLMFGGAPISGGTSMPNGFVGTAQFGYNYQKGSVVFGIEGDLARRRTTDYTNLLGANGLDSINLQSEPGWVGTVRPRAGLAVDNWLFYGTGGVAYDSTNTDLRPGAGSPRTGFTVGGGLEYVGGKQWSLGLEYLYAEFGKSPQSQTGQAPGDDRSQILRGKLNYRFGWDGFAK